jgi:hypothetical protein
LVAARGVEVRLELARLEREAELRMQVVQAVVTAKNLPGAAQTMASTLSDAELVRLEAARSAAMSWQYATLVERELDDPAAALREYERVVARFPGTPWAELAAQSVSRLSSARQPSTL